MFTFKKLALVGLAGLTAFAMSCSDDDPPAPVDLKKETLVLSGADNSYGDVDAAKGYIRVANSAKPNLVPLTKDLAATIDLIAFATSDITPSMDSLYTPAGAGEVKVGDDNDIFYTLASEGKGTYSIKMTELPAGSHIEIEKLGTSADLEQFDIPALLAALPAGSKDLKAIKLENNKSFLLTTSTGDMVAIVLKAVSTTSPTSVTLNITYMPK
jgi:hypothetical protein